MYDVIVVGAGISGLLSALVFSKNEKKVLVLEKN
ncbi:MAG: FAD-dependent oxidoreductase [Methanosarcinales archaeon]